MSLFDELLAKPLPSAMKNAGDSITESEDILCQDGADVDTPVIPPITQDPVPPHIDMDEPEDIPITTPVGVTTQVGGDEAVPELSPEQSQRVDDTINAVATPLLLKECSEEELAEFLESSDLDVAVAEGYLTERTVIKFDKDAKRAQLYEIAVAAVARAHKDPLMRKLDTVYKMERILKAKLRKKYHLEASKKVKEYLARAKKSKSGLLAKIAAKLSK